MSLVIFFVAILAICILQTSPVMSFGICSQARMSVHQGVKNMKMMPIGIPKVPYRIPGPTGRHMPAEWVDVYTRLQRDRIIFISNEIDEEYANSLIAMMLYLDNEKSQLPIYLYINCPGGNVLSGLAIYDTMKHIKCDIVTVVLGTAASMASFLAAAGTPGKRFALQHSRIMIHQPAGGAQGQAEDIRIEADQILKIRDNIVKMYSKMTGQSIERVLADLDRDNYMSAEEAVRYGLVDEIVEPNSEKIRLLNTPPAAASKLLGSEAPTDSSGNEEFGKLSISKGKRRPSK